MSGACYGLIFYCSSIRTLVLGCPPSTGDRSHVAAAVLEITASGWSLQDCAIKAMPVKTWTQHGRRGVTNRCIKQQCTFLATNCLGEIMKYRNFARKARSDVFRVQNSQGVEAENEALSCNSYWGLVQYYSHWRFHEVLLCRLISPLSWYLLAKQLHYSSK